MFHSKSEPARFLLQAAPEQASNDDINAAALCAAGTEIHLERMEPTKQACVAI